MVGHGFHGFEEGWVDVFAGDVVEVLYDHIVVSPGHLFRERVFHVFCDGGF